MNVTPRDDSERLAAYIMKEVMTRNLLVLMDADDKCYEREDEECEGMKAVYWNVHAFEQLSALIRDVIG